MRLRHLARIGPSANEIRGLGPGDEVTFAPMDSLADGLGGLDTSLTRPLSELTTGSYNYFAEGDILLAKVTPCFENGKKAVAGNLINGVGFATSEVHVIRPDRRKIDTGFLRYLLCSEDFRAEAMKSMTGAGGLRRVSENGVLDYHPKIKDVKTQRTIADFLDRETARIDQLIEKKKRLMTLLDEKRAALLEEAASHSGRETRLGHHVEILPGYAFASTGFSSDAEDIRLLRGANVTPSELRWDEVVYWPRDRVMEVSRFLLRPGDVVLGMDRPWISSGIRVAELRDQDAPSLLLQRVCRILPRRTMHKGFMKMLLAGRRFLGHFEPILTGVSVPHIGADQIAAFRFGYLDLSCQAEIARRFEAHDACLQKTKSLIAASIDRLREVRAALVTAAVAGQIDVATWRRRNETDRRLDQIEEAMRA